MKTKPLAFTIRQILIAGGAALFTASTYAALGQQNPPPGPGQVPDYFGVTPNYATSPQPVLSTVTISGPGSGAMAVATTYDYTSDVMTDKIMDVQILNGGSGYNASTTVTVNGGILNTDGSWAASVTLTPIIQTVGGISGVIVGFNEIPSANNPATLPNFSGLGSGFSVALPGTGIRKFVDSLPTLNTANNLGQQLPVAVPDQNTFPGSDYYEIEEGQYTMQLHSDLPPTHLRGYRQINASGPVSTYQYLGPVIVAHKNRPVRIKLVNKLPIGNSLPMPVDTTYMGAEDTDDRTALHLHGGNTPWISDGTPRQWVKPAGASNNKGETARNVPDMWFDASGNVVPVASLPSNPAAAGLSNNPGNGALTFFYTNEQSARLMFYHDHAEGTTRLNVYAGMAAGYILQDDTEQGLVNDGTLPPLADTIPLIIQEKTFVPDTTMPVLNFYGPFASALQSQDPTWRWGSGTAAPGLRGNGDLWVPHVFMPNQNPGDVTGANAVGRWDYGAWFWPPFAALQNLPIANPYYDPNCNTTTDYCEGPDIPGVPNGSTTGVDIHDGTGHVIGHTTSPSGTPEAFNDTPLVNGTAYPYINVDPKKYRLRFLSVGNDRMLNLSLVVAASKNSDTTAAANSAANNTSGQGAVLCDGTTTVAPADCTEVKMVPFDSYQNAKKPFPSHWYTTQKGGVSFDGRPSGVFDPATRGPAMVQIGTEGGFLSTPVVIPNQPVNYEYNPKNILIGNVKEHALFLGPAERADVLVDFTNFAGSTLILYNDSPAPVPAWDLRLDYYTGNFDNTDTGGAFSVIPGYGPNSRTLMQIRVSTNGGTSTHPVDDLGSITMASLTPKIQAAFKTSQEPIIVPQSPYNAVYGINATDKTGQDLSRISDFSLSYKPLDTVSKNSLLNTSVTLEMEPKTIIEDWTMNWGRMNALLGTEVPHTTAINQTSIPQAYIDPPTDLVKFTPNDNGQPITGTLPDGTQLWKITHNGVDSHAMHFHLFHVQLINRVGWDGAIYPPDANELGWKDTVRMNPLSDTIVALRPMTMQLPFKLGNSHHRINPLLPLHATSDEFFNFSPLTGNASNVTNEEVNYGWEYLWHCHILGHEENDMMRTIAVAQPPEAPEITKVEQTGNSSNRKVTVTWNDNSMTSNWVTLQRSSTPNFATVDKTFNVVRPECASQAGCVRSYDDTTATSTTASYYYRIMANNTVGAGDWKLDGRRSAGLYLDSLPSDVTGNGGLTPGFTDYANVTANSDWSNVMGKTVAAPIAVVSPTTLAFGEHAVNSSTVLPVTLSNTGTLSLTISTSNRSSIRITGNNDNQFSVPTNPCGSSLVANATCTINITFRPTSTGNKTATLTITDNSNNVTNSTQTVTLSGKGVLLPPTATLDVSALTFPDTMVPIPSAAQTVTLTNTGSTNLTVNRAMPFTGPFTRTGGTCTTGNNGTFTLAAGASCTVNVTFTPTVTGAATGTLAITNTGINGATAGTQTVSLSGNGIALVVTANPDTATATASTSTNTQTVTVNVRANDIPANTGTVAFVSLTKTATGFATVAVTGNNIVLSMQASGNSNKARAAARRGVYTVTYSLTANGTTVQSTATITVN